MRRLLFAAAFVGFSLLIPASAAQRPAQPGDSIDVFIRTEMMRRQIPGLAVAVLRDGKIVKTTAYGTASLEYGTPVTTGTLFNVASVSKAFTGVGIIRLVEDGAVSLEDPIGKHLADLPPAWRHVPVRRLLNHTSGLPIVDADQYSMRTRAQTVPAALNLLAAEPLESSTGTKWTYNQTNYLLLGMLIEKVSGRTFIEFCAERLFIPFGLHAARFGDSRAVVANRATVYTRFRFDTDPPQRLNNLEVLSYETPVFNYPAGGLNISIGEFSKWLAALQGGRIVSRQALSETWKPAVFEDGAAYAGQGTAWTSYGLGWTLDLGAKHAKVGGTGGLRAGFALYPNDNLAVIVLTNLQGAGPDSLLDGVAALYLDAASK